MINQDSSTNRVVTSEQRNKELTLPELINISSSPTKEPHVASSDSLYKYWQNRILYSIIFGYATYYLVRMNFSLAAPSLYATYGYTKTDLGIVFTIWSIIYGIGKFINGYLSDRANARLFMSIGLLGSALTSLFMSFGDGILFFCLVWGTNAWFQSMGWPPVSKLLTHWYPPTQLGTKWGIANLSHHIGGALIPVLTVYLIDNFGWKSALYVPAIISFIMVFFLYERLRDTPKSLGLPSIEVKAGLVSDQNQMQEKVSPLELLKLVFFNKMIWCICLGNMFLYVVRMGVVNWAPSFLSEYKGATLTSSGWQLGLYEIGGMIGGITAGWLSDKLFEGRRGPISCMNTLALIGCLLYFWYVPAGHDILNAVTMFAVAYFIYGTQVLVGVAAADFASKSAVGMAVGLTGTFAYVGSAISGWGIGWIADNYGWNGAFMFFIASAILSSLCFALTWSNRAKVLENP